MAKRTILPVSPDEFKFAFAVGMAAAAKKGPYRNPALHGFELRDDETGEVTRYSATDNGLARATFAVLDQFDDREKCVAIMMRINGMMDLIDDERMKPYIRPAEGNDMEVRDEVLEVAAEAKMSSKRGFNPTQFFRKVEQRINATAAT